MAAIDQPKGRISPDPVTLAGRFVRLEPLAADHLPGLCAAGLEGNVTRWFPVPVTDAAGMAAFVDSAVAWQRQGGAVPFATRWLADGRIAGSTRFANLDPANRHVEIGWTWLGRPWQRTAANTEAKLLMLTHAFEVWNCLRVEFKTDSLNLQSQQALERLGAMREGVFRKHVVCADGRLRDSVWFSIVDHEWPEIKRRLIDRLDRGATVLSPLSPLSSLS